MASSPKSSLEAGLKSKLERPLVADTAALAQMLVDHAAEAMFVMDREGRAVFMNRAAEQMFGFTREQMLGAVLHDVVHSKHPDGTPYPISECPLGAVFRNGRATRDHEDTFFTRDGTQVEVLCSNSPVIEEGEVKAAVLVVADITERKRMAREIAQREAEMRTLLSNIPEVVCRYTPDLRYRYVSPSVLHASGMPPSAFIGKTHAEVGFSPELAARFDDSLRRVFATGKGESLEFKYELDGELRYYAGDAVAEKDEDGNVAWVLTVTRDVTATRRAEEEFRRSEERFRLAVDAGSIGVWDWHIAEDRINWSDRIYEFHGLSREQFRGTVAEFAALVHPDDLAQVQTCLTATLEQDAPYVVEFRTVRRDGSVRWLSTRARVFRSPEGVPLRMVGAVMDITDRKHAEEALRRSEKLAATGRLAASMAHEINNPLEAVTNLLYLLRGQPLTPEGREFLQMADAELGRASHLTRKSLGFYRESQTPSQVMVRQMAQEVFDIYRSRSAQKGVTLHNDVPAELAVYAIPGEVRQILSNLFSNSLDAVSAAGRISIAARAENGMAHIVIADDGCGIPAEIQPNIFEPFFTTKQDIGTGLGLWLSRELVQKNGGTIDVTSQTGDASCTSFTVTLPTRVHPS